MNQFIGAWKLVSSQFRDETGKVIYPYGENAFGLIMYEPGGRMSVHIIRADRPPFASGDLFRGSPDEIKAALEGYIGYYGTYTIDESEGTIAHHVEGSAFPNWIGGVQKRYYLFEGNRLTLRTPPIPASGSSLTGILIWERLG